MQRSKAGKEVIRKIALPILLSLSIFVVIDSMFRFTQISALRFQSFSLDTTNMLRVIPCVACLEAASSINVMSKREFCKHFMHHAEEKHAHGYSVWTIEFAAEQIFVSRRRKKHACECRFIKNLRPMIHPDIDFASDDMSQTQN